MVTLIKISDRLNKIYGISYPSDFEVEYGPKVLQKVERLQSVQ